MQTSVSFLVITSSKGGAWILAHTLFLKKNRKMRAYRPCQAKGSRGGSEPFTPSCSPPCPSANTRKQPTHRSIGNMRMKGLAHSQTHTADPTCVPERTSQPVPPPRWARVHRHARRFAQPRIPSRSMHMCTCYNMKHTHTGLRAQPDSHSRPNTHVRAPNSQVHPGGASDAFTSSAKLAHAIHRIVHT